MIASLLILAVVSTWFICTGIIIPHTPSMCEQARHDIRTLNSQSDIDLKEKAEIVLRCIKFIMLIGMFAAPMTIMKGRWNP